MEISEFTWLEGKKVDERYGCTGSQTLRKIQMV